MGKPKSRRLLTADDTGAIIWRDNGIMAVVVFKSGNVKTGNIGQVHIIRDDMNPFDAQKTGDDSAICGECSFRPILGGSCYVLTFQGPSNVYKKYVRGGYPDLSMHSPEDIAVELNYKCGQRGIRWGAYGDPAYIPLNIIAALSEKMPVAVGYTHQWRVVDKAYSQFFMASVDNANQLRMAKAFGYRTFRVVADYEEKEANEVVCPAARTKNAVKCRECGLCSGTSRGRTKDVVIKVHGSRKGRFNKKKKK